MRDTFMNTLYLHPKLCPPLPQTSMYFLRIYSMLTLGSNFLVQLASLCKLFKFCLLALAIIQGKSGEDERSNDEGVVAQVKSATRLR